MNWEWESAPGAWTRFAPSESAILSSAFQRSDPFETLPPINGRTSAVSFESVHGLQTNLTSQASLPVRRIRGRPALWEARTGQWSWTAYDPDVCARIEAAWEACNAAGTVGTSSAFIDLALTFQSGNGGHYRISFRLADGVQEDGRRLGLMRCVRRTAVPLGVTGGTGASSVARHEMQAAAHLPATQGGAARTQGQVPLSFGAAQGSGTSGDYGAGPSCASPVPDAAYVPVATLAERCSICLDEDPREDCGFITLSRCGHGFHEICVRTHMNLRPLCPLCFKSYGVRTGNQPPGDMSVRHHAPNVCPLEGHATEGTIEIVYAIPDGIQGQEHPRPGEMYSGAYRKAYLPDSSEGREVLSLLQVAFERKLIFTVGRSITSGRDNCVTWSSVHHKTSRRGGQRAYGWPDPTYLARVSEDLAFLGVT